MKVTIERDGDQVLAAYIRLREGTIARTVEISGGAAYADEDDNGNLLGVEILAPK